MFDSEREEEDWPSDMEVPSDGRWTNENYMDLGKWMVQRKHKRMREEMQGDNSSSGDEKESQPSAKQAMRQRSIDTGSSGGKMKRVAVDPGSTGTGGHRSDPPGGFVEDSSPGGSDSGTRPNQKTNKDRSDGENIDEDLSTGRAGPSGTRPRPRPAGATGFGMTEGMEQDRSRPKDNVVVMKFIEDGPRDRLNRLLKNPIKLEKYMRESSLGNIFILDYKPNYIRGHIVIIYDPSYDILDVLGRNTFGPSDDLFSVDCRSPYGGRSVGVLGPIDEDVAIWEIEDYFKETGVNFVNIERMWKGKKEDGLVARCIKITFEGNEMPGTIKFGHRYLEVRPYFPQVIQCFKCQGFGHRADDCISKDETCVKCSEKHMTKDCKKDIEKHELKCSNCKGNHVASYRGCRVAKEAQEIQVIKTLDKVPYSTAKARYREWKKESGESNNESREEEGTVDEGSVPGNSDKESRPKPTPNDSFKSKTIVDFRKSYAGRVKYGKTAHKSSQTDDSELKKILDVNTDGDQILKICSFIVTVQRILSDKGNLNKLDMLKESIHTSLGISVDDRVVKQLFLNGDDDKQEERMNGITDNGRQFI